MNQTNQDPTQEGTTTVLPPSFYIRFSYGDKSVNISLLKGDDIFKLAKVFENILTENGIEYDVETMENKIC
jgi:hypothetical protein